VSAQTPQVKELLVDMKLHNKNYVYVDIKYFTDAEFMKFVTEVLPSHVFNMVNEPYGSHMDYVERRWRKERLHFGGVERKDSRVAKSSFVFENEYDYVGGIFELYQRIYQDDEEVMEISPPSLYSTAGVMAV
jgi:hypothetical protein